MELCSPRVTLLVPGMGLSAGIWDEMMRWLEKDDLLLYVTALIGVVAPLFIYILYHRVHAFYINYKQVRRLISGTVGDVVRERLGFAV